MSLHMYLGVLLADSAQTGSSEHQGNVCVYTSNMRDFDRQVEGFFRLSWRWLPRGKCCQGSAAQLYELPSYSSFN